MKSDREKKSKLLPRWKLLLAIAVDDRFGRSEVAVAALLLQHYNDAKGCSWPSTNLMAKQASLHVRTVIRAVDRLVTAGYFKARRKRGRGVVNIYYPVFKRGERAVIPPDDAHAEGETGSDDVKLGPRLKPEDKCDIGDLKTWPPCPENVAWLSREPVDEPAEEPVIVRLEGKSSQLGLSRELPAPENGDRRMSLRQIWRGG